MQIKYVSVIMLLLLILCTEVNAQKKHKVKLWHASVILDGGRVKGELYRASDSSVTIIGIDRKPDEIFYREISKIKLRRMGGRGLQKTIGVVAGSALGAWGSVSVLTKGRTGGPSAMAGVVGGIGGGILGGIIGFFAAPPIYNLITSKKFIVTSDPSSYPGLKEKLMLYIQ